MKIAGLVFCSVILAGCGAIGELLDPPPTPVIASLEVFNRTEMEITLLAADGERLVVPACDRAQDDDFRIDAVRVGADGLYVRGFGVGGDLAGQEVVLVELADAGESGVPQPGPPPDPLPPCQGTPQTQPGVPLQELG
jgi:hypothetical protein